MDQFDNTSTTGAEDAFVQILRGLFVGVLAVAAIAVWAINFEPVFMGKGTGPLGILARLVLCDVVPLATLVALYRGIGRNESLESICRGILRTITGRFKSTPASRVGEESSHDLFGPPTN